MASVIMTFLLIIVLVFIILIIVLGGANPGEGDDARESVLTKKTGWWWTIQGGKLSFKYQNDDALMFVFQVAIWPSRRPRRRRQRTAHSSRPRFSIPTNTSCNALIHSWPSKAKGLWSSSINSTWTERRQSKYSETPVNKAHRLTRPLWESPWILRSN